ncbi:hypothetical protein EDD85DRAFT_781890, partial [Armillaria nabsnona]
LDISLNHTHLDHTGDVSKFPRTTKLVVGPGSDLRTYPSDPSAKSIESDLAYVSIYRFRPFSKVSLRIADLPALDYFGDGSFTSWILQHPTGHLSALARVTPATFILLASRPGPLPPYGGYAACSSLRESFSKHLI